MAWHSWNAFKKNNLVITGTLVLITINAQSAFRFNKGTWKFSRTGDIHIYSIFHITSNLLVQSSSHNPKNTNVIHRFLSKQHLKKRKQLQFKPVLNQQVLFLIKYYNKTSRQKTKPWKPRCSTIARNEKPSKLVKE